MDPVLTIAGITCAAVLVPLVMYIAMYNALIGLRNRVRESWSDIDTELKRRYDLIPNLVNTVKGYAAHEQGIFERIAELRSQAMADNARGVQIDTEKQLSKALGQVLVAVEGYPELKANQNFLKLMHELAMTEDRIQAARRFYNANVRDYNIKIESFPSNLVASMHHCTQD
ncbi:MAG TPA: LemA family protein, partial [Planctomycetota bacterium]|nr:LemA family protein [Planctomycetota bacterium]